MDRNRRVGASVGLLVVGLAILPFVAKRSSADEGPPAWCEPTEAIRSQIEAIDTWGTDCLPAQPCWRQRLEAAKKLLAAQPDDLFVNQTYQDLLRMGSREDPNPLSALRAECRARADRSPSDPVAQYLAARIAENADEERKLYEKALVIAPEFPWAHRGLVVVEANKRERASRNQQMMKRELARFMTLCPDQVNAVLQLASAIEDEAFWREHLAGLRAAVHTARPREQRRAYPLLWSLEFRLTPLAQHPQLRTEVALELKSIEDLRLLDDPSWWWVCSQGLDLTGDAEGKKRLIAELAKKNPCSRQGVDATFENWQADHPRPAEDVSEQERDTLAKSWYDATTEWLARCPEEFQFWFARLGAIGGRKELPNGAVRADLDHVLEVWERNKNHIKMGESPYVRVARLFLDRNLELERVPSLVEKEIELCRAEREELKSWREEKTRQEMMASESVQMARLQVLEGRAELALARKDAARKELNAAAAQLDALRADDTESPRVAMVLRSAEAELWEQRAALAVAEGHTLDAAAMLLKASTLAPDWKELTEKAKALWRRAGGANDGWTALTAVLAEAKPAGLTVASEQSGWEKLSTNLKPFDLQGLDGKRWTLEDLRGKVAFVNVWATWCGPCREELPAVQKLYERLKDSKDVVLLTLNVDSAIGPVAPFLANKKYSFPVLLADAYIRDLWKDSLEIPRNWILDRAGLVRYEQRGFNPKARDSWADSVLKLIDALTTTR